MKRRTIILPHPPRCSCAECGAARLPPAPQPAATPAVDRPYMARDATPTLTFNPFAAVLGDRGPRR